MSGDTSSPRFGVTMETRRRWREDEKLAFVREAIAPDVNVSAIARRHGIKTRLLVRWRTVMAQAV